MNKRARSVGAIASTIICVAISILLLALRLNGVVKAYSDDKSIEEDINKAMKTEDAHYATNRTYTLCIMNPEDDESDTATESTKMSGDWIDPLSDSGLNMSGSDAAFDTATIAGYALSARGYRTVISLNNDSITPDDLPVGAMVCIDVSYCAEDVSKVVYDSKFHNRGIGSGYLAASIYANLIDKDGAADGPETFKKDIINPQIPYCLVDFAVDDNSKIDKDIIIKNGEDLASGILAALEEND